MEITTDFHGGNIKIISVNGDEITVDRDMRDSSGSWFYWAFCVKGAAGRTLRFKFASPPRVGYWGPAVSHDLKHWEWGGGSCGELYDSFCYTFGAEEQQVWFAHHILYLPEYFFSFAEKNGLEVRTLCKTAQGRDLPYVTFGSGDKTALLTARHHCCESTGNYVMEGVIKELLEKKPGLSIIAVPFVDYDGVCCGDQGKNRIPHDPNRDYIENSIYPGVRAIKDITAGKNVQYAFDFHSPSHFGGRNDLPFIVRKNNGENLRRFADTLENCIKEGAFRYRAENDILPGEEWNKLTGQTQCAAYFLSRGARLAFTLETAYFGRECDPVTPEKLRLLGESFADAVIKFDK